MACRQIWEDIYAIEVFKTGTTLAQITAGNVVFGTGVHGVAGSFNTNHKFNMLVDGSYPALKASYELVEKNLATGKSMQNVVALTPVTSKPENVTIPLVFNAHNLALVMRLMFQDGVTIATGTANTALQIMTCVPYQDACPIAFANLVRFRQESAGTALVDQALKGVVPTRIMIKGEEGGVIEGEVEFMGAGWSQGDYSDKLAACLAFDTLPPLKFEDLTVKFNSGTSQTVSIPSFEFTFQNTMTHKYYNQTTAQEVTMGRLSVEAQITIPWNDASTEGTNKQITDFIAGTNKVVSLIWGNPSTAVGIGSSTASLRGGVDTLQANAKNQVLNNYFAIHALMKITGYDENDIDDSPMIQTNFRAVEDQYSTLAGVTVYVGYLLTSNDWTGL